MEGVVERSMIGVYSAHCGLTLSADVALFFGESDMEVVVEKSTIAVYSVPFGVTWGADVAQADTEAFTLWGVTD